MFSLLTSLASLLVSIPGQATNERWNYSSRFTAGTLTAGRRDGKGKYQTENVKEIVETLDAQFGLFLLKCCFSLSKLLYFLRTSKCFNHPTFLGKYDKTVRGASSKVCFVNFDNISSTQLALPVEMFGHGVSTASVIILPAFLTSAFGASDFLTRIFSDTFTDVSFTEALERRLSLTKEQENSLDKTEKIDTTWLRSNVPRFEF